VAAAEDGRAFFAWTFWDAETEMRDVWGRSFGTDRNPETPEFQINNHSAGSLMAPCVATNPSGNSTVVVWEDEDLDGSDFGVFAVVNPNGFEPFSVGHWNLYR
jgi:hypothetical protein